MVFMLLFMFTSVILFCRGRRWPQSAWAKMGESLLHLRKVLLVEGHQVEDDRGQAGEDGRGDEGGRKARSRAE